MPDQTLWVLAVVGGPLILGVAFVYGLLRQRRLTRQERQAQHEGIQEVYREREKEK